MGLLRFFENGTFNATMFVFFTVSILIAITIHEFMHAWVAYYLGDNTPKNEGRVTLNPLAHLDPFGTIMLFLVGFGWGKPVMMNPNNFKNPRLGSALTGVAGPLSNFALALLLSFVYKVSLGVNPYLSLFLVTLIFYNIVLMVFNLLPIPPLDGSHILAIWFPQVEDPKNSLYGMAILVAFIFFGGTYLLLAIKMIMSLLGVPLF
jgi:Zn-dependent protease